MLLCGMAQGSLPVCEIWDVPETGLVTLAVPETVTGTGTLRVLCDGVELPSQEIVGAGECVVRLSPEQRTKAKTTALKIEMERTATSQAHPVRVSSLVVGTDAFSLTFDAQKRGGLPNRLVWASGRDCDRIGWGDRVYAAGNDQGLAGVWPLQACRTGEVLDYGKGAFFRQVRTVGEFARAGGKLCDAHPRAVYDWIFPNDAPEWVYLRMSFSEDSAGIWDQVQAGILEVPFGVFDRFDTDGTADALPTVSRRASGTRWSALLAKDDFAAVYSPENCSYVDASRKIVYLHASARSSYAESWSGDALVRTGFYRFGRTANPSAAFDVSPPFCTARGLRRLDLLAQLDAVRPGERVLNWKMPGGLAVDLGIVAGTRAEIRA